MRIQHAFSLLLFLVLFGCTPQEDTKELYSTIKDLEQKVEANQSELKALTLKTRISTSLLFLSPLEQFFQSDEFWENTIDVAKEECHKRCIESLQRRYKSCNDITDEDERKACFEAALESAVNCHKQCSDL